MAILLIDDSENDILLLRRAISKARITSALHAAKDGEEAIDYLSGRGAYGDRSR